MIDLLRPSKNKIIVFIVLIFLFYCDFIAGIIPYSVILKIYFPLTPLLFILPSHSLFDLMLGSWIFFIFFAILYTYLLACVITFLWKKLSNKFLTYKFIERNKSNIRTIALITMIITITLGSGIYWWQQNEKKQIITINNATQKEPLTYSTSSALVSVSKKTMPFDYTSEQLTSMAAKCGSQHNNDYFEQLISKFIGETKIIYTFKNIWSENPESDAFIVTLLPNKADYTSLEQFTKDFNICTTDGEAYPVKLNTNWLVFFNSCESKSNDNSKQICHEIRKIVEPTLEIQP